VADTNTANIGLLLPDLGDTFNFALHVENNFSTVDSMMGAPDCTSTTRPSNTYKGQIAYEHDSGRYVQNTGTKASPVWTYMSHSAMSSTSSAHPTSGLSTGLQIYETDTALSAIYNGSSFLYPSGQLLAKTVLSGTSASVTFSNIPQNFTNLRLVMSAISSGGTAQGWDSGLVQFNGVSSTTYNWNTIYATQGGAPSTASGTSATSSQFSAVWNAHFASAGRGVNTAFFPNYSNATARKGFSSYGSASDGGAAGVMQSWSGSNSTVTAAITSLTLLLNVGSFTSGSVFCLYGE